MVICLQRGADLISLHPKTPSSAFASFKSRLVYLSGTSLPRLSWNSSSVVTCAAILPPRDHLHLRFRPCAQYVCSMNVFLYECTCMYTRCKTDVPMLKKQLEFSSTFFTTPFPYFYCYLGNYERSYTHTHTHTHQFNSLFYGTTWVSQYQKGKTNLDFTEARVSEWQWHQLGHCLLYTSPSPRDS